MKDVKVAVAWSQAGLGFFSWIHTLFIFAWILGAIVNGFNTGILHVAPAAYEVLVVKVLADSLCSGPRTIVLAVCMLVLAIGLNITHLVLTSIELGDCTSALCTSAAFWFLVSFAVILGLLIVLEAVVIYFLIRYKWHVQLLSKVK